MGKMKGVLEDWLDNYGYSLGYDMTNYPDMNDWDDIKINNINAEDYYEDKKDK